MAIICAGQAHPDPARGVFETLAVRDGRLQALGRHLQRLSFATAELYDRPLAPGLADRLREVARPLTGRHRMRVDVRPGSAGLEVGISSEPLVRKAASAPILLAPVHVRGGLGQHKWSDRRLIDRLSSSHQTPLILDVDGRVLEAGWANVWIVEGERVITPPADGRLLPGVTRLLLLEHAGALGLTAAEEPISMTRAGEADGLFLTSSVRHAVGAALPLATKSRGGRRHSGSLAAPADRLRNRDAVVEVVRGGLSGLEWE